VSFGSELGGCNLPIKRTLALDEWHRVWSENPITMKTRGHMGPSQGARYANVKSRQLGVLEIDLIRRIVEAPIVERVLEVATKL